MCVLGGGGPLSTVFGYLHLLVYPIKCSIFSTATVHGGFHWFWVKNEPALNNVLPQSGGDEEGRAHAQLYQT